MECGEVRARILVPENDSDAVSAHLASCADCALYARSMRRVDALVRPALVLEAPPSLQNSLVALARAAAVPSVAPAAAPVVEPLPRAAGRDLDFLPRGLPSVLQLVAAFTLVLAVWQLLAWVRDSTFDVGDVVYALGVLFSSPAVSYLGALQFDVTGLLLWSALGTLVWLLSATGSLGRFLPQLSALD